MIREQFPPSSDKTNKSDDRTEEKLIAQLFEQYGTLRHYKKNEVIFREDDECQEVFFVQDGLVKISQSAQEGQGITLFLRHTGEAFGMAEVLAGQKRQRYARCIIDSQVLALAASQFTNLVMREPDVLYALTVTNARRLLSTQRYVETLISRPVAWRLAHLLMQLGRVKGTEIEVALSLSHEEISYIIGCSRQTVSETLSRWREQGVIQYEKKRVVISDSQHFMSNL
ncbi:hypothetical protein SD70_13455 [Gordoniibacillus kamchatkensis]|uniref:Crp/Fnr family transcriptional regulator n=1 Tax=Gordoniibacillus kamchatkensis TaxID=1590651 RepID=A0ABR5AHB5_9BACL|nr:Crp/Fnr family transcriptional regulator [Paenibacillus sp. VKM B-2647]KIL40421.1 hypothetical protein SD70_13455 [Paenibacillus sp. VKM B-2647]